MRIRIWHCISALLLAVPLCSSAAVPALPPLVRAPTDAAEFRRFVLDNGMRVLLVSDPKFNKSSAGLVVETGAIDDPAETEGLTHFLEHMLLLGSEKYPDVTDYANYIRANGGYRNATTYSDRTNFRFEVNHDAFVGGLDRFAAFFIAPKFDPDFTGREVSAVHNEAMRHVQNDSRRLGRVLSEVYATGAPEARFSTGNKDTLAGATPAVVRQYYEAHYTADRMALALAGRMPLDELEQLARSRFSPIARRVVTAPLRTQVFLPPKNALRMVFAEPVKDLRRLQIEFALPTTRPDFASRPVELIRELMNHPGAGGLVDTLKREGLANTFEADIWERTRNYGSLLIQIDLTPAGQNDYRRVLALVAGHLEFLRQAPFPTAFYRERARVAHLEETYGNRGEGADFAASLATDALYFPLAVAERAAKAWGAPDEAAYRRFLDVLKADNMIVALMAKGVATDRTERIYKTKYSYREETGPAFDAVMRPASLAAFALPGANIFTAANADVLPEQPLLLVDEPGLRLYHAPDTEFQRPETAIVLRFVPVRELAAVESAALLRLYEACLADMLEQAVGEARLAGVRFTSAVALDGLKLNISGFGDSPVRFANHLTEHLREVKVDTGRFASIRETTLRTLQSYGETEAYLLARDRRDAFAREPYYLPSDLMAGVSAASAADVQAFARRFFARGKLEAVMHGNLAAGPAIDAARGFARRIGAEAAPVTALQTRRNVGLAAGENIVDAGPIAGTNSAFISDYLLPDDSPRTRAAATVIAAYISSPFYSELRTRQQLGYIVGSSPNASLRERYFTFTVQSSTHAPDDLRRRVETLLATFPAALAAVSPAEWATLLTGARATLGQRPKSLPEKAEQFFESAFVFDGEWDRRQSALRALDSLTPAQVSALLQAAIAPETARRRTIMLYAKAHAPKEELRPTFADRAAWKGSRTYR